VFAAWQKNSNGHFRGGGGSEGEGEEESCYGGVSGFESGGGGGEGRGELCEESQIDILRLVSHIDFYLPFLPLQRPQVCGGGGGGGGGGRCLCVCL